MANAPLESRPLHLRDQLQAESIDYLEGLFEGFVAYDANWRTTYMNGAAERIVGRKREEIIGKTWQEAFAHAVGGPVDRMYQRVMHNRAAERMELYYEHYGRWFEISAAPLRNGGVAVYFRDIDDLKHREEAQARLAAIVESSDDAIVSKSLEGIIQSWNAGAERIFGYTSAEAVGQAITLIIPDERRHEEVDILARLRRGERIDHYETVRRAKDGRPIDVSLTVSPVRDASGHVIAASKVARDITARKQAEQALQDASRYKDEFLATLAHELRNPLAPIRNGLQLLRMVDPASEPALQARAIMERQLEHLVRLVDDLMEVSRITRGKIDLRRETIDVAAVMMSAVETSRPAIEAGRHHFSFQLPAEPLMVNGDFVRLAQVISNLLNNAAKYTDNGGQISLGAEREGEQALIRVRDSGIGIPADIMPRIFDMFAQAHASLARSSGGLGIGLALARSLVEMHGGRIAAQSAGEGRGSEFTVRLPLLAMAAGAPARTPKERAGSVRQKSQRVLIVDDNADAAQSLEMLLRELGHDVQVVHDGHAAVAAARGRRPDMVFLDIGMPGMNGLEVARRLRQQPDLHSVRVAAVTGFGQEEDRRRTREAGFDEHLVKPVSPEALRRVLER
jgi:PAS domain S-box-containing protein